MKVPIRTESLSKYYAVRLLSYTMKPTCGWVSADGFDIIISLAKVISQRALDPLENYSRKCFKLWRTDKMNIQYFSLNWSRIWDNEDKDRS
jgi:hypothetical protein